MSLPVDRMLTDPQVFLLYQQSPVAFAAVARDLAPLFTETVSNPIRKKPAATHTRKLSPLHPKVQTNPLIAAEEK